MCWLRLSPCIGIHLRSLHCLQAPCAAQGKKAAREALRYRLGLTGWGDKPLVGVVTRLTEQKGGRTHHLDCARASRRLSKETLLMLHAIGLGSCGLRILFCVPVSVKVARVVLK